MKGDSAIEYDPDAWVKKARAFVTRSHRHLWGKNNEDPQAFLFNQGLKNSFIKERVMGWNKFSQDRPAVNWGAKEDAASEAKLHLAAGIVFPYIIIKELKSVFIHPLDTGDTARTTRVPGSVNSTIILGDAQNRVVFLQDIFDGLFLCQEKREALCVMIHPDARLPVDSIAQSIVQKADQVFVCSSGTAQKEAGKQMFSQIPIDCFHSYSSKENLTDIC